MLIKSHDDQLLTDHLLGTYEWAMHFMGLSHNKIIKDIPGDILKDCLILHDIGKATPYFQKHLEGLSVDPGLKAHSLFSALLFLYSRIQNGISESDETTVFIAFVSILLHHSDLISIDSVLKKDFEREKDNLKKQWISLGNRDILKSILLKCNIDNKIIEIITEADMDNVVNAVQTFIRKRRLKSYEALNNGKVNKEFNLDEYFRLQNFFSLLINSDKSQVVLRNVELVTRHNISTISVRKYMDVKNIGKILTPLNVLRQNAFCEVDRCINEITPDSKRILELTLPTGMGKTLISFNFAFGLWRKLEREMGRKYRIIYVLPFLSIVDQNSKILEDIIKTIAPDLKNTSIKHHHLSPVKWEGDEMNIDFNYNMAEIFIEGWNADIIITSFVQFFETLIGYTNKRLRKYINLANSIVIIDEIQALPIKYYSLIRETLHSFVALADSYIIAMTATQPRIFLPNQVNVLCDSQKYFKTVDRIILKNQIDNPMTIAEFIDSVNFKDNKKYLIILNTIQCAKVVFNLLSKKYPDKNGSFISSQVIPVHRLKRIKLMKKGIYDFVVSTQVVEAGVDINFDVLYRDLAPLPAIIQSSGRANREGTGDNKGVVNIIKLIDGSGRTYASHTYRHSKVDLEYTQKILSKKLEYSEIQLFEAINEYFNIICDKSVISQDESYKILKAMSIGEYQGCGLPDVTPISEFKLIEENYDDLPVFIETSKYAAKLWNEYDSLYNNREIDKWEHKNKLADIINKMSVYLINVSSSYLKKVNRPPEVNSFLYVSKNQIENYYDCITGFGKDGALTY